MVLKLLATQLFVKLTTMKITKLRITVRLWGKLPVTDGFPSHRDSNKVSSYMSWRHHYFSVRSFPDSTKLVLPGWERRLPANHATPPSIVRSSILPWQCDIRILLRRCSNDQVWISPCLAEFILEIIKTYLMFSIIPQRRNGPVYHAYSQYHDCWRPSDTKSQGIITHGISRVLLECINRVLLEYFSFRTWAQSHYKDRLSQVLGIPILGRRHLFETAPRSITLNLSVNSSNQFGDQHILTTNLISTFRGKFTRTLWKVSLSFSKYNRNLAQILNMSLINSTYWHDRLTRHIIQKNRYERVNFMYLRKLIPTKIQKRLNS